VQSGSSLPTFQKNSSPWWWWQQAPLKRR
jgi:hypothetical protein